jgi:hypothetical protein
MEKPGLILRPRFLRYFLPYWREMFDSLMPGD